jgi:phospholipid:diacylglycerol acyltransferase
VAPGLLDSDVLGLQTLEHAMRVSRTWDSTISLIPKGGDTIWGDLDSSPEEGKNCNFGKKNNSDSNGKTIFIVKKESPNFGRLVSFGKEASELPSSQLPVLTSKDFMHESVVRNSSCGQVWTEYDEMSRESIKKVAVNKAYTAKTVLDLLRFVAPKMMKRAESQFSHGLAENLDDPKYDHYKYWSNPLETKLPNAPDMEVYCLYGVGVPTERSYVYKLSPSDRCKSIPYRIDNSADGDVRPDGFLKGGVYFTDGDACTPVLSAGFMCARGWRGKTRFNPSGSATYIREYNHKAPASFLEGRGAESGAHVDIMGNVALIEDVLKVAAGAAGGEIGGDRIYSDILKMSERVKIRL